MPLVDEEGHQKIKDYAISYHKEIVGILDDIKRELLLVLKTNNYLRAIDRKLGFPTNTFTMINDATWKVFKDEIQHESRKILFNEYWRYIKLKIQLWFYRLYLKIRQMLWFSIEEVDQDEFFDDIDLAL